MLSSAGRVVDVVYEKVRVTGQYVHVLVRFAPKVNEPVPLYDSLVV